LRESYMPIKLPTCMIGKPETVEFSLPTRLGLIEQVAAQIEEFVLAGRLEIGTKLPSAGELATQFSVSRPVIREALAQLRAHGLVETVNGIGTYVRRPDSDHLSDVLLRHMRLDTLARPLVIENLYEARMAVEVMAAGLAAERASGAERRLIADCVADMRAAQGDPQVWISADMRFHQAIADAAHNFLLAAFLLPMTKIIEQGISESWRDPAAVRAGLAAHETILRAIEIGDEAGARGAMLEHLQDSKLRVSSTLGLPPDGVVVTPTPVPAAKALEEKT
jgi:GntR family transcriptional repressor for pyruvate dehydrogenase complex